MAVNREVVPPLHGPPLLSKEHICLVELLGETSSSIHPLEGPSSKECQTWA